MTDSARSGGVDVEGGATVGEDIVGRDKFVTTNNVYAGLTIGDMFRLRLVLTYERLWGLLEPLAKYGRTVPFTTEAARALSEQLRHWYFEEAGGLYLLFSTEHAARDAYFELQESLKRIVEGVTLDHWETEVALEVFEATRQKGSELRHAMAEEIRGYMQAAGAADTSST